MIDVRCPQCGKLLFKAQGFGTQIEAHCPRCKINLLWPANVAEIIPSDQRAERQERPITEQSPRPMQRPNR